jgi:hypothetical protein
MHSVLTLKGQRPHGGQGQAGQTQNAYPHEDMFLVHGSASSFLQKRRGLGLGQSAELGSMLALRGLGSQ